RRMAAGEAEVARSRCVGADRRLEGTQPAAQNEASTRTIGALNGYLHFRRARRADPLVAEHPADARRPGVSGAGRRRLDRGSGFRAAIRVYGMDTRVTAD